MTRAIPLTLVGGYLGAGKTTLVNGLLAGDHGLRLAVLVNDFGEVDIDGRLIVDHDGETYTLANGCICCSIGDDLGETLRALASAAEPPDAVIVEASGVADARRLAASTGEWFGFDHHATIVLADAETVRARADDVYVGDLVRSQLTGADLVVLNKVDLVGAAAVDELVGWCRSIGVAAPVLPTREAAIPVEVLTDVGVSRTPDGALGADHTAVFHTSVLRPSAAWRRADLERALDGLPPSVIRVKGIVDVEPDDERVVVQAVGRRWRLTPATPADDGAPVLVVVAVGAPPDPDLFRGLPG